MTFTITSEVDDAHLNQRTDQRAGAAHIGETA